MVKTKRLPHAPSEPLPELSKFLAPFCFGFTLDKSFTSLERYRSRDYLLLLDVAVVTQVVNIINNGLDS